PYRPDPAQPARATRPGASAIWEVPLTIRPRALRRPHWLRPTRGSARSLIALARRVLDEPAVDFAGGGATPPVLNVMFHNVEVVAGASPYAAREAEARAIVERLAALLAFARDAGAVSVGLGDVP